MVSYPNAITGPVTVTGDLTVTGNESVTGTLGVTGATTLTAGATFGGYSQVNASFGVTGDSTVLGNEIINAVGSGLKVKEGANARMGTAVLNGVTEVTVANTSVTATSRIFITVESPGGTVGGAAYVSSRIAGTSFGIKGLVVGDTSTVAWMIVEPS